MATAEQFDRAQTAPTTRDLIRRYSYPFRRRLWHFSDLSNRHRDLLTSFPAAALAVVTRPRNDPSRMAAMRCIEGGTPLLMLARTLQLSYWLRRLPPEAFLSPPPRTPPVRGDDAHFGARLLNHMPGQPAATANWFETVSAARTTGDDELALWVAGLKAVRMPTPRTLPLQLLALYAWHSCRPESEVGRLAPAPWSPALSLATASDHARSWLLRLLGEDCLCEIAGAPVVVDNTQVDGFDIVPLTRPAAILDEAIAMRNCLAQYVKSVTFNRCRLYGVRRDGQRVATFEIRRAYPGTPYLRQLKGPRNSDAGDEVEAAVAMWLERERSGLAGAFEPRLRPESEELLSRRVWQPFAARQGAHGRFDAGAPAPCIADLTHEAELLGAFVE